MEMIQYAAASHHLHPTGIAMHIGSQIREISSFVQAAQLVTDLAIELKSGGLGLAYIDIGGGLGIDYGQAESDLTASERDIKDWVNQVGRPVRTAGFRLKAEPGRSIMGAAGALVTQVTLAKFNQQKQFLIADAGMNDLLRPPLYQAIHPILPIKALNGTNQQTVDVVGPICESSDFLGKDMALPIIRRGDRLAVMNAGAYGFAMSSNYNGRLRAAEVLVDGGSWRVIRSRQEYTDLI